MPCEHYWRTIRKRRKNPLLDLLWPFFLKDGEWEYTQVCQKCGIIVKI